MESENLSSVDLKGSSQSISRKYSLKHVLTKEQLEYDFRLHEIVDPLLHKCFRYKKLPENRSSTTNT